MSILYNSFLPALTLVLAGFGWNILSMKSLAVSTKEESYVTFARLKGTTDWRRMTSYVFRNAMLPQVTALVLSLGTIFNGALLTEMIFSYPGIGFAMRSAAGAGDYNLLYGAIILTIVSVATAALVLDLIYPLFDPRIRLGEIADMTAQACPSRRKLPKLNCPSSMPGSTSGLTIVTILAAGSLILPFFTFVDPAAQGTYLKNLPPSGAHLLGTNALGQDIFWYLVFRSAQLA